MRIAMIAAIALLATSAAAFEDVDGSFEKAMPNRKADLARILEFSLYDGASARLRNVRKESPRAVCGWLNARNLNGAYAGFRPFYVDLDEGVLMSSKSTSGDITVSQAQAMGVGGISCVDAKGLPK